MKQRTTISTRWTASLAYIVGCIATDGNMSPDGRHIVLTSKDEELLVAIKHFLRVQNSIGKKSNGTTQEKKYFVLQLGDVHFYTFLISLGITQKKSKTIRSVLIPKKFFRHFLRGCIDGDGNFDIYTHKESANFQFRIRLASASKEFLLWIHEETKAHLNLEGGWIYSPKEKSWHVLTYGKKESIEIVRFIYSRKTIYLHRKFKKVESFL